MAQLNIQDILNMMRQNIGSSQVTNLEAEKLAASMQGQTMPSNIDSMPINLDGGQITNLEADKLAQAMASQSMPAMPTNETFRNYADGQMPLYIGGLLQNPQGDMVDPQQLMNIAYDMNAPREMRINAIERLRALGVQ